MTPSDEITTYLLVAFPELGPTFRINSLLEGGIRCTWEPINPQLRPGGTLAGPVLFAAADVVAYGLLLASYGFQRGAVTSNMSINFLNRPKPGPLHIAARTLRKGNKLFVADIGLTTQDLLCAHAVATYMVPD
jgi:acyl-coenzyme A thioesterase PaaI-like protein